MSMDYLAELPFELNSEQIQWVKNTLHGLSIEEKIGQMIMWRPQSNTISDLADELKEVAVGGVIQHKNKKETLYEMNRFLQNNAKVPMLIAANLPEGPAALIEDGTFVGSAAKITATHDEKLAYQLGDISGIEANAIGINSVLGPSLDMPLNRNNPNLSTQMWSDDSQTLASFASNYMEGIGSSDILPILQHFPGEGTDWRDVNQTLSINQCSFEEWKKTFGYSYRHLIREGAPIIMVGGNAFPDYVRQTVQDVSPHDIFMPANMSPVITTHLLRGTLGFNGLIMSDDVNKPMYSEVDAVHSAVIDMVNAGCQMIVTSGNPSYVFNEIHEGIQKRILDMDRINQSVTTILAMKTMLGLDEGIPFLNACDKDTQLAKIHQTKNQLAQGEVADKGLTLLKDRQRLIPFDSNMKGKIYVVPMDSQSDSYIAERLVHLLHEEQFNAECLPENSDHFIAQEVTTDDILLYVTTKKANQLEQHKTVIPGRYHHLNGIFVSLNDPFYLRQIPQIGTYINAYDAHDTTLMSLVAKLVGHSRFSGSAPFKIKQEDEMALY